MTLNAYVDVFDLYYGCLINNQNADKGSDVNLATRPLIDAFDKAFDAAVIITNDSKSG